MNTNTINNLRFLFILPISPVYNAGGARQGFNFAQFLHKNGIKVKIIFPKRSRFENKSLPSFVKSVLYWNKNIYTKIFSFIFFILPQYFFFCIEYDVFFIYGGSVIGFEFILLFSKLFDKKVIFRSTLLGDDDIKTLTGNFFLGRIRKYLFHNIHMYFAINTFFAEYWKEIYPDSKNIFLSPQGVNSKIFAPPTLSEKISLRKKWNILPDIPVIVSIGYIIKRKGFPEIFRILSQIEKPYLFVVVGDLNISDKHYMTSFSKEIAHNVKLGRNILGNKIIFLGKKNEIAEILKLSDIFLSFSSREGLPNVLLEAMSTGLCCIVKEIKGLKDFVHIDGYNTIVVSNFLSLKEKLQTILTNHYNCIEISNNAREWILENASYDIILKKIIEFNEARQ